MPPKDEEEAEADFSAPSKDEEMEDAPSLSGWARNEPAVIA